MKKRNLEYQSIVFIFLNRVKEGLTTISIWGIDKMKEVRKGTHGYGTGREVVPDREKSKSKSIRVGGCLVSSRNSQEAGGEIERSPSGQIREGLIYHFKGFGFYCMCDAKPLEDSEQRKHICSVSLFFFKFYKLLYLAKYLR